jgi:hypothetical protein
MQQAPVLAMPAVFFMTTVPEGCGVPLASPAEQRKHGQTRSKNRKDAKMATHGKDDVPWIQLTTICFRNVPNTYSGKNFMELLDVHGFKDGYDFMYVPHDFKRLPVLVNVGYFFANFVTHDVALRAWEKFDGFKEWETESDKVLSPSWATRTQGLEACIDSYQNNPVMHPDVPLECKPFTIESGKAVQLIPNKRVRKARLKTATPRVAHDYHGHSTANAWVEDAHHLTANAPESTCGSTSEGFSYSESTGYSSFSSRADSGISSTDLLSFAAVDSAAAAVSTQGFTWVPDEAVHSCFTCSTPFTFLRRRHHCRACGNIFCAECAPRTRVKLDKCKLKRLCLDCAAGLGAAPPSVREELLEQASPRRSPESSARLSKGGLGEEPYLVVKNTFVTPPRSDSTEDVFNRPTSSFPL